MSNIVSKVLCEEAYLLYSARSCDIYTKLSYDLSTRRSAQLMACILDRLGHYASSKCRLSPVVMIVAHTHFTYPQKDGQVKLA